MVMRWFRSFWGNASASPQSLENTIMQDLSKPLHEQLVAQNILPALSTVIKQDPPTMASMIDTLMGNLHHSPEVCKIALGGLQ